MKVSLLSVALLLLPLISLLVVISFLAIEVKTTMVMLYGFCIFFGWLTAIIFGMTFKTLPFIVWNKVYHQKASAGKTPAPKELFSESIFKGMSVAYLAGFVIFITGIILLNNLLLKTGAVFLLMTAVLYVWNVGITLSHRPKRTD